MKVAIPIRLKEEEDEEEEEEVVEEVVVVGGTKKNETKTTKTMAKTTTKFRINPSCQQRTIEFHIKTNKIQIT